MDAPPPQARRRVQSDTPDFDSNQGYLRQHVPGTNGIDAEYSWTFAGGNGEGITIYDIGMLITKTFILPFQRFLIPGMRTSTMKV